MASSLNGTGITFSDGSALATAAPSLSQVGGHLMGYYTVNSPTVAQIYLPYAANAVSAAGSTVAYNYGINTTSGKYYIPIDNTVAYGNFSTAASTFPASSSVNGSSGYNTASGTWRNVTPFTLAKSGTACCGYSASWPAVLWQRIA